MARRLRGQGTERESINQHQRSVRQRVEHSRCGFAIDVRWCRIASGQAMNLHTPPARRQTRNDLAIVAVAAGLRVDIAGNKQMKLLHQLRATGPSNAAHATCDSCSVTRMVAIPAASAPSAPS